MKFLKKEIYDSLNFKCKRIIDRADKNGEISILSFDKPDLDRCKALTERGILKPMYGSWCGELIKYKIL